LLIASVITVPLELKIFEREILDRIERNHTLQLNEDIQRIDQKYGEIADLHKQNSALTDAIREKEGQRNEAFHEVQGEASGSRGTGIPGAGPVWKQKTRFLEQLDTELYELRAYNNAKMQQNTVRIADLNKARDREIAQKDAILQEANGLLARLNVLHALIKEQSTTATAFALIAMMFVVIETSPLVVKLLSKYGPYDAIVEQKETEVTLAEQRKMAAIPEKLQREVANEQAIADVVQHFVLQQFEQAIHRTALSQDVGAIHETIAARIREEYREAMLRHIRRAFHPAASDPEVIRAARAAEANRDRERREQGRKAQTMHTRIETAKAFMTRKLREYIGMHRDY
jgi:hypothetical protein